MPIQRAGAVTGEGYFRSVVSDLKRAGAVDPYVWYTSPTGPLGMKAERHGLILPALDDIADAPVALAHLNRDQWIICCPDCVGDFQLAFAFGLFMCSRCWNESIGGSFRRSVFPEDHDEIEASLAAFPRAARNWLPGWTVQYAVTEAAMTRNYTRAQYREALRGATVEA